LSKLAVNVSAATRRAGFKKRNYQFKNKIMLENENINEPQNPAFLVAAVMPRYFYKDGSEVKENDIVFYSEDGGDHKYHYADSIGIIVKRENDFKMKAYVITMTDAKSFEDYEEPEHNMVSLKYGCENYYQWNKNLPNTLQHFTKIGEYPKDEVMLSAEFAMERYVYNGA
jgi:hypothetical protein